MTFFIDANKEDLVCCTTIIKQHFIHRYSLTHSGDVRSALTGPVLHHMAKPAMTHGLAIDPVDETADQYVPVAQSCQFDLGHGQLAREVCRPANLPTWRSPVNFREVSKN